MRRLIVIVVFLGFALLLLYPLALALVALNSPPPPDVGLGQIRPCPETPNCVSSHPAEQPESVVLPLYYTGEQFIAEAFLIEALEAQPRTQVVLDHDGYIHAERRSRVFRFVDDVEFRFNDQTKEIAVRSAARLGYSDGGANRRFIEQLRDEFNRLQR